MDSEKIIWKGRPGLIIAFSDFRLYSLPLLTAVIYVGCLQFFTEEVSRSVLTYGGTLWCAILLWDLIVVRCISYKVTAEKLIVKTGVLNRRTEVCELYRVKDYTLFEPIILRLFGLSNLHIVSSDRSMPTAELRAIPKGLATMKSIRKQVEAERERKHARELDTGGGLSV
ncbi:PH domain-containing protein [Vibrio mediterranei]|uniref:PH domain-containing protein n=1 Tax=Vibrio mediterranei TaxID=689 RepID=UPI004067BA5B